MNTIDKIKEILIKLHIFLDVYIISSSKLKLAYTYKNYNTEKYKNYNIETFDEIFDRLKYMV